LEDPKEEIRLMNRLSLAGGHAGILKLLAHIHHEHYQWTVLEFCSGGEFFDLIANGGRLPPAVAARYFRQVADAVDFMHSNNVAHLDLSLENLLLDGNDHVKICDFGMAREIKTRVITTPRHNSNTSSRCSTPTLPSPISSPSSLTASSSLTSFDTSGPSSMCMDDDTDTDNDTLATLGSTEEVELFHGKPGKIGYMAPEVFEGKGFDGRAADVWSCGIMLFMMLTGIPPWKLPANSDERYRLIMAGQLAKLLHAWNTPIPQPAMELLSHMLCPAAQRWSIKEILKHPFIAAAGAPSVPCTPMVRSLSIQSIDTSPQQQVVAVPST
jgi:serine/threonine protein kinase